MRQDEKVLWRAIEGARQVAQDLLEVEVLSDVADVADAAVKLFHRLLKVYMDGKASPVLSCSENPNSCLRSDEAASSPAPTPAVPSRETTAAPTPEAPRAEPEQKPLTLDQLRMACVNAAKNGETHKVTAYLREHNAAKLTELKPEDYEELFALVGGVR